MNDVMRAKIRATIERRSVQIPEGKGCRLWLGPPGTHGYGAIRVGDRVMTTARATYLAFNGELERGEVPRHTCDVKLCVRPDHLIRGTNADNADDWKRRRTEHKVLDPEKVVAIRARAELGEPSRKIAADFGVCHRTIQKVVGREDWSHVP